jgi:hypothetical protein
MNTIVFKPSYIHQGHHVVINGKSTGMVVNLHAYENPDCADYKKRVDSEIKLLTKLK